MVFVTLIFGAFSMSHISGPLVFRAIPQRDAEHCWGERFYGEIIRRHYPDTLRRAQRPICLWSTCFALVWTGDKRLGLLTRSLTGKNNDNIIVLKTNGKLFVLGISRNYRVDTLRGFK